ncbi:hypothetical protein ACWEPP_36360, partial [Streptomyces murinus]
MACDKLGVAPDDALMVGDEPIADVRRCHAGVPGPASTPAGFRCLTWSFAGWRECSGTSIVRGRSH